jgi:flagellar biosynthesis/type III secretory pathway chaperone
MNEHVDFLVEALREELKQYGEMLALLEQQQRLVIQRASDALLQSLALINAQASVIQLARHERERCQGEMNERLQLPADATFTRLYSRLPEPYAPLVKALVDEINVCLQRVHQNSRQNHLLLSRSVEMMQRFIARVFPSSSVTTYDQSGKASASGMPRAGLCEVVG